MQSDKEFEKKNARVIKSFLSFWKADKHFRISMVLSVLALLVSVIRS